MDASEKISLGLELSINEESGRPRAAYLQVRTGDVHETREVAPGKAYADYDAEGQLLPVESCKENAIRALTVRFQQARWFETVHRGPARLLRC